MELFISQDRRPTDPRHTYLNPRFFNGLDAKVKKVHLDGDWPKIEAACMEARVKLVRVNPPAPAPAASEPPASLAEKLAGRPPSPAAAVSDAG